VSDQTEVNSVAIDHAWKWFEYHATQRMTMLRFYLIAAGGIGAGVGVLLAANESFLAGAISVIGMLTSYSFKQLDRRVSDLVKIGEDALNSEQQKMSAELNSKVWKICKRGGVRRRGACLYTYGENLRFLFNVLTISFFLMALLSFVRAVLPYVPHCLCHF
jgi:hypothetical protein